MANGLGIKVTIDKSASIADMKSKLQEMMAELQKQADNKPLKVVFDQSQLNSVMDALRDIEKQAKNIGAVNISNNLKDAVKIARELGSEMDNVTKIQGKITSKGVSSKVTTQTSPSQTVSVSKDTSGQETWQVINNLAQASKQAYSELIRLSKELNSDEIKLLSTEGEQAKVIKDRVDYTRDLINQQSKFIKDNNLTNEERNVELLREQTKLQQQFNEAKAKAIDKIASQSKVSAEKDIAEKQLSAYKESESALNRLYSVKQKMLKAGESEAVVLGEIITKEKQRFNDNIGLTNEEQRIKLLEREKKLQEDLRILQSRRDDSSLTPSSSNGTTSLKATLGQMAQFTIVQSAVMGAINQLRQGIVFANDMNKAMTEISIVTGKNQEQVSKLAKEYNDLAREMGSTTEEIAKASVEYYRQGLSQDQVNEKMQQTIQYAKVSGLGMEESATILTATVNSMGVTAQKASDVFAYMGDATATGADEIGRAFQVVGGSASALQVPFEKVSSWIATVSAKTRESAENIGNSMKGLMSRYQSLKEKGFAEEDGTQVNQVAKSLNEVGIEIIDQQGNFRNFGTVMDELGKKWSGLSNRQQAYISTTLAGTHQQSRFLNLMNSYGDSVSLYEKSLNSAGTTQNKYNLYLEGTEAHINKLKATAEGVWLQLFNSQDMKGAIDTLTSMVSVFGKMSNAIGALPTVFGTAIAGLMAFKREFQALQVTSDFKKGQGGFFSSLDLSSNMTEVQNIINRYKANLASLESAQVATGNGAVNMGMRFRALTTAINLETVATIGCKLATQALNAVIGMGIGMAVGFAMEQIMKIINAKKELKRTTEELTQTVAQNIQQNRSNMQSLASMSEEYEKLSGSTNLTTEEQKKLISMNNQIAQMSPELVTGYDEQGNAIVKLRNGIKGLIEDYKEKNRLEQQKLAGNFGKTKDVYNNDMNESKRQASFYQDRIDTNDGMIAKITAEMKELERAGDTTSQKYQNLTMQLRNYKTENASYLAQLKQEQLNMSQLTTEFEKNAVALKNSNDTYVQLDAETKRMADSMVNTIPAMDLSTESVGRFVEVAKDPEMVKQLKELEELNFDKTKMSTEQFKQKLEEIVAEMSKINNGKLNADEFQRVIDMFNGASEPIERTVSAEQSYEQGMQKIISTMNNAKGVIKEVNQIIDQHTKSNEWNLEAIEKLANEGYPELLKIYGDDEAMEKRLIEIKGEKVKATENSVQGQMNAEANLLNSLGKAYGVDVSNFSMKEDAKTKALKNAINQRITAMQQELIQMETWARNAQAQAEATLGVAPGFTDGMGFSTGATVLRDRIRRANLDLIKVDAHSGNYYNFKEVGSSLGKNIGNTGSSYYDGKKGNADTPSKSSSNSQTIYESKLDGADKYTAVLEDINNLLSKQDDIMSQLDEKIKIYKDLKDVASLTKAIELENSLYTEQGKKVSMLQSFLGTMNSKKTEIANEFKNLWQIDVINYNKSDFTKQFERIFPTMTTTNKAWADQYEQLKKKFNTLTDDYFKFQDSISSTEQSILSTKNEMMSTIADAYDIYFTNVDSRFDKIINQIDSLNNEMSMLGENKSFDKQEEIQQEIISKTTEYKMTIEDVINQLEQKKSKLEGNSFEWNIVNEKVLEYQKTLQETNKELLDANEALKNIKNTEYNNAMSLLDKIKGALLDKYSKEKQDELDNLTKSTEVEVTLRQKELDALRKELEQMQDDRDEKRKNLIALKQELALWQKDNSIYAKGKVLELQKQIKEREKELSIADKQEEIKKTEEKLQKIKDTSTEEEKRINEKYKKLTEEQALYEQATQILTSGSQEQILNLLLSFDERYKGIGQTLGQSFRENLLEEISIGMDSFSSLLNGIYPSISATVDKINSIKLPDFSPFTGDTPQTTQPAQPTPSPSPSAQSSNKGQVHDVSSKLNVRNSPNGAVIGALYPNETAEIIGESNGWYNVRYWSDVYKKNREGWVSGQYFKRIVSGQQGSPQPDAFGTTYTLSPYDDVVANNPQQQEEPNYSYSSKKEDRQAPTDNRGDTVVSIAEKYIGTPYVWGGTSPSGFDCSGLVQYAYKQMGIAIGRTTYDQVKNGVKVSTSNLKKGDLLFYGSASAPNHVAMYAGNGQMVEAPRPGKRVTLTPMRTPTTARRIVGFDTGGETGSWDDTSGKLAILHQKERILTAEQTKAFNKLVYDMLPNFNMMDANRIASDVMYKVEYNAPIVQNEIKITNNTPFDVTNNLDNLNKALKNELRSAGYKMNLIK